MDLGQLILEGQKFSPFLVTNYIWNYSYQNISITKVGPNISDFFDSCINWVSVVLEPDDPDLNSVRHLFSYTTLTLW